MQDDRTQLMGGTEDYPLNPASAMSIEACPFCRMTIPPGEQFCLKCGYQRETWAETAADSAGARSLSPFVLADGAGAEYALPLGEATFGRGEVDLPVADGYLSRRHVLFIATEQGVSVKDLGSANGSYLGERKLAADEVVQLQDGDVLKLGQGLYTLKKTEVAVGQPSLAAEGTGSRAEMPAPPAGMPAPQEVTPMPEEAAGAPGLAPIGELVEMHAEIAPATSPWSLARPGEEPEFFLPYGESILGRKPDKATIVVRGDGYISGAHLRLLASETTLEATDLGSTNGSFINGEQLTPGLVRQLGAGDSLRLGQTELSVCYNEIGEAKSETET
jgi:pSer/pThr/pTyr-binding forkhead associated (FHA) protein